MPETLDLSQYDEEVVAKAFWLQEHIRRYGLDGIQYSEVGERVAADEGPEIIAANISKEFRKL
jgi:hypothetical protein